MHSTARLFGTRTKPLLVLFYGVATLLFAAAWFTAGVGPVAWLGLAAGAVHLGWQVVRLDIDNPDNCLMLFRSNEHYGWIVFAGLVADGIVRSL